jgi:hypothetical protein
MGKQILALVLKWIALVNHNKSSGPPNAGKEFSNNPPVSTNRSPGSNRATLGSTNDAPGSTNTLLGSTDDWL